MQGKSPTRTQRLKVLQRIKDFVTRMKKVQKKT